MQGGAGGKREGPRAGGGLSSAQRKKISRGGVYIGMEGDFWLARQGKKRAGLLVWAEKVFPIFLFTKKNSTNSI